jgi:D-lyxose ketol-isomerase
VKRSEINEIMAEADAMMRSFGFVLPPFAYWTPDEMKARRGAIDAIVSGRMGWDITDYGQGDFEKLGLFLFTLRNGRLADLQGWGHVLCREAIDFKARSGQPNASALPEGRGYH